MEPKDEVMSHPARQQNLLDVHVRQSVEGQEQAGVETVARSIIVYSIWGRPHFIMHHRLAITWWTCPTPTTTQSSMATKHHARAPLTSRLIYPAQNARVMQ